MPRLHPAHLDAIDVALLEALTENARASLADLARAVGLSAPSVSERVKRLESAGVITGYRAEIDPSRLGLGLTAWIRIRPTPGKLHSVARLLRDQPAITVCDRITGEDCFIAQAHIADVAELEALIDRLMPNAMTNTSVVQSSPVPRRLPPLTNAPQDADSMPPSRRQTTAQG